MKELIINEKIRANEVRLISETGEQLGIVSISEANALALEKGLDLALISPNAVPPVCKILDYGKYKFEAQKKEKESRKNQKIVEVKTIQLSLTIGENDMKYRANRVKEFVDDGNKIKVNMLLKGRQQAYGDKGIEVMKKFAEMVSEWTVIEKEPAREGKFINMTLSKKKI